MRGHIARAIALWCLGFASSAGAQQPIDAANYKPVVMLLVDSSGSMERLPNTETRTDQLPDCNVPDKNRWTITLESLTGTLDDFGCEVINRATLSPREYDYGYHLPHFRPTFTSQNPTGALDVHWSRIKFGLMTFDTVGTYVDGPVFESFTALQNSRDRTTARGMYSYGRVGKLVFPGCTTAYGIDNGTRNTDAPFGRLVPPARSENTSEMLSVNQTIQQALIGTVDEDFTDGLRPFGGTPIAGMLDDLQFFLENDPSVAPNQDDAFMCRDRVAVLITDGKPDSDFRDPRFNCEPSDPGEEERCVAEAGEPCSCPYEEPVEYVRTLRDRMSGRRLLDEFHVVALSLSEEEEALTLLNLLAEEGGTEEARLADDAAALNDALNRILDVNEDTSARTSPVVRQSNRAQLELRGGFEIGLQSAAWEGVLQRQRFLCEAASSSDPLEPTPQPLVNEEGGPKDLLHEALEEQSTADRNIQVLHVPRENAQDRVLGRAVINESFSGDTVNRQGVEQEVEPDRSLADWPEETTTTDVEPIDLTLLSDEQRRTMYGNSLDLTGDGNVDDDDDAYASAWLAGDTAVTSALSEQGAQDPHARQSKLAGIFHSQPVVVGPSAADTTNGALNDFLEALQDQPEVVIVGSVDGLLHAFSLETADYPGTDGSFAESVLGLDGNAMDISEHAPGDELWAIAPPAALPHVPTAATSNQQLFDGAPIVRNVTLARELGSLIDSAEPYRRILIAALRGLPAFVAFDITNVAEPRFLWQFTHPMLGNTVGQPALAQLRIHWNGVDQERAIALLPGGQGELRGCGAQDTPAVIVPPDGENGRKRGNGIRCWRHQGRYLYAVDVSTGELVQVFDHNIFPSPLTGGVAIDQDNIGVAATAAYLTDDDGILFRVDFRSTDPTQWGVQPVWDLFANDESDEPDREGRPSIHPPLLQENEIGGNWVVVVGTGDVDNLRDGVAHRIVSLTEESLDFDNGPHERARMQRNWEIDLEENEGVTGPLVFFDDTVYFASFQPDGNENACATGESKIWGVHFMDTEEESDDPVSVFTDPDTDTPVDNLNASLSGFSDLASTLVLGVSIHQEPPCIGGDPETDTFLGNRFVPDGSVNGGEFKLRALTSGSGETPVDNSRFNQTDIEIPQPDRTLRQVLGGFGSVLE